MKAEAARFDRNFPKVYTGEKFESRYEDGLFLTAHGMLRTRVGQKMRRKISIERVWRLS